MLKVTVTGVRMRVRARFRVTGQTILNGQPLAAP